MTRKVSTTEALMTDPTTPEGAAYWQGRHDYERQLEDMMVHVPVVLLNRIDRAVRALRDYDLTEDENVELERIGRDLDALLDAASERTP